MALPAVGLVRGRSVQRLQLSAKRQNRLHELNNLFSITIVKE